MSRKSRFSNFASAPYALNPFHPSCLGIPADQRVEPGIGGWRVRWCTVCPYPWHRDAQAAMVTCPGHGISWERRPSAPNLRRPRPSRVTQRRQREAHLSAGASYVDRAPAVAIAGGSADGARETIMTKQAGFKRRVRARMAKTGESYAAGSSPSTQARVWPRYRSFPPGLRRRRDR